MWTEVMSELSVENVRPVTPDRESLEAISMAINIRAERVIQMQHELLEAQKQQDLTDEQEFYAQVGCCLFQFEHFILVHIICYYATVYISASTCEQPLTIGLEK